MIIKTVLDKVQAQIENKIAKLEDKKENYQFPSSYQFDKCLDELYLYKEFLKVLLNERSKNDEIRK